MTRRTTKPTAPPAATASPAGYPPADAASDVAASLTAAAVALEQERGDDALAEALRAWRALPHPAIAALVRCRSSAR